MGPTETTREKIARATVDAINAMVSRLGEESYYLAYNATTGKYRIYGDCVDSHSESYLYAVLTFEEDQLRVDLQDCKHREFEYANPDYMQLVLEAVHPGSKLITLNWD